MTEDEARTKWCQFAMSPMVSDEKGYPAVNRGANGADDWCFCIAPECMVWRTIVGVNYNGYCGLAGGPAGYVDA